MDYARERELTDTELTTVTGGGSSTTQTFNVGDLESLSISIEGGKLTETFSFASTSDAPTGPLASS